jgi:hypothetical protein
VAGIPHRVVLPDASHFFTDFLSIDGYPEQFLYYLNPHFVHLASDGVDFTIPGLMTNGYLRSGVRLQVENGIPSGDLKTNISTEDLGFDPKLNAYDPNFEYSSDVVTGGRAACYFDFDYGTAEWLFPLGGERPAWRLSITVETNGYPRLLVTPLNRTPDAPAFKEIELGQSTDVTLEVSNLETGSKEEEKDQCEGRFDFLFNFLTGRGGIPQYIVKPTPGLESPSSATNEQIAAALQNLASMLTSRAQNPAAFYARRHNLVGQTPACSPSEFG